MRLTLTLREAFPATPRARLLRLDLAGQPFPYLAGQAVFAGTHGQDDRRPYSLASSPSDVVRDGWLELLVSVDRDGRAGPHLAIEPGGRIDVEGPIGAFTLPPSRPGERLLFIAGGVGIAPLRAMLHEALDAGDARIGVLYSARRPDEFAFERELGALANAGRIELRLTVTRDASQEWTGGRGRITRAELAPVVHGPETLCFVCGPQAMVDEIPGLLVALGVERRRIRIEEW